MIPMTLFDEISLSERQASPHRSSQRCARRKASRGLPQCRVVLDISIYFLMQRGWLMMFNEGMIRHVSLRELRRLPSFSEVLRVFFPAIGHPANKCPYEFVLLNSKTCKSVQVHHDIGQGKVCKVPQ